MVATLQQRSEAAKKEIASLNARIEKSLRSKRDGSLAATFHRPLAPVRTPPSQVKCRRLLKGHFGKITALDWSADGTTIVSASQDGNLLLWDALLTSKKQDVRLKSPYVMSVCMEKSGRYVAAGGLDNACSIYTVGDPGPAKLKTELVSHEGYLADCKFFHSPSKMLTASGDATSLLWDVEKGQIIESFREHKANLTEVQLVESDQYLSSSTDTTIKLWDVRQGGKAGSAQTFSGHAGDVNGITVLPNTNGAFCSCSEDGTVRVWDLRAYGEVARFGQLSQQSERDPFSDGDAGFTSISASRSGRLVFCGHSEGSVVCYDILSPSNGATPAYVLQNAHEEHVSCVGVSPTGEALCTGSWDFNLKLFA
mmetsp:Transcript_5150/g.14989  ORF Transcript_5150/g.14989 Transcript_5150/m.14989 type:complete len:367 (+) Transcript_5150:117-1217(+)|eukprot:CAMPEP_0172362676 /NCGR_PEP_ID=MMETSP1060-20121228/6231_1 /TAXON_ID=37318 /ORGANISM="Pseudo-nitzschia pungens, Strain cf. cingulata" /LENGTH=366 /DNA_ID=CAMNT_0013085231 /DNA_START=99 /DNA_END=1199 /DNA_ORIENTATION=+